MTKLTITYKDWVHCQVNGLTNEDLHNVYNGLRVFNPNARFQPLYKMGRWDGYINFFGLTGVTYTNLLPELFSKINIKQYEIEELFPEDIILDPNLGEPIDENYMSDLTWYKGHRLEGKPIILEEHQVRCINAMIYQHRGLLEAATGAGKTLLSAALCRKVKPFGKVVLIVDGKDLCIQTADELNKFGCDAGIVGCGIRDFGHEVSVCTWQTINSISKKSKDSLTKEELENLVDGVVAMIFDECFDGDTLITLSDGSLKKIKDFNGGESIISYNEEKGIFEEDIVEKLHVNLPVSSPEDMYEIEMENGNIIKVTGNHKVLTNTGWKQVKELSLDDDILSYDK